MEVGGRHRPTDLANESDERRGGVCSIDWMTHSKMSDLSETVALDRNDYWKTVKT